MKIYKKLIIISLSLLISFNLCCFYISKKSKYTLNANTVKTEIYNGEIKNIFIHSLIAYPEILQTKNKYTIKKYDIDCIDYLEFENLLNELYKNNYVLIDINKTFYVDSNGIAKKSKIKIPVGKKPIVLGVDDVVYDPSKSENGMVDKLCIDENGEIYTKTKINNKIDISYNREFAPILENFICSHPDFSFENARCCINLTGFCGILGYRITDNNTDLRNKEIIECKKVVNRLKKLGYTFACHSFSHYHIKKVSTDYIKQDLQDWKNFIEPVIDKTNIFVYPYGEWEIAYQNDLSLKQQILCKYGFKLFLGVGIYDFYTEMPLNKNISNKILFADRKNIDGYTLFNRNKELEDLFDCKKIISSYASKRNSI